jgi:hypothetical protein
MSNDRWHKISIMTRSGARPLADAAHIAYASWRARRF